ncbi:MAG: U32 family peptidase [Erysipelotrichaceae bacterium]|nr:U32 family peptidase [Erysipelotrichaceae bacterium]
MPDAARLAVSHALISDGRFSSGKSVLSKEQIAGLIAAAHRQGIRAVIRVDRLYGEDELDDLCAYLHFLDECQADGLLISDLAVWMMKEREGLSLPCLYGPETLLTSSSEIAQLISDGLEGCVISKEVPFENACAIARNNEKHCWLRIYGPLLLSYSKRRFISLYLNDDKEHSDGYYLQEETRDLMMPMIEKKTGSWLYGPTLHALDRIKEIAALPLRGVILDGVFDSDEQVLKALKLHLQVREGQLSCCEALSRMPDPDGRRAYLSISQIRDTVVNKEEA